jgi:hypothetical protein
MRCHTKSDADALESISLVRRHKRKFKSHLKFNRQRVHLRRRLVFSIFKLKPSRYCEKGGCAREQPYGVMLFNQQQLFVVVFFVRSQYISVPLDCEEQANHELCSPMPKINASARTLFAPSREPPVTIFFGVYFY